jgi:hypothetical protein
MSKNADRIHSPNCAHLMMQLLFLCAVTMIAAVQPAVAKKSTGSLTTGNLTSVGRSSQHAALTRDRHGRIARSSKAKGDFKGTAPCPATGRRSGACSGYVVDHIVLLERGGQDTPTNMQWQTVSDAKAKDRLE